MPISIPKCAVLHYGLHSLSHQYSIGMQHIIAVDNCMDLGILRDTSLSYDNHVLNVALKCNRFVGMVMKAFSTRSPDFLVKIFTTYVRPILEYASVIWSPLSVAMRGMLEKVQRRFMRRLYGSKESNHDMRQVALRKSTRTRGYFKLSYTRRLKMLRLQALEHRRFYHDLLLIYKSLHERIAVSHKSLGLRLYNAPTRSGGLKLQHYRPKNKTTAASFLCKAPITE